MVRIAEPCIRAEPTPPALVGTASVNAAAIALYRSAGFEVIDRERFYTKRV